MVVPPSTLWKKREEVKEKIYPLEVLEILKGIEEDILKVVSSISIWSASNIGYFWLRWVPQSEKGKFVTFAFNGGTVGAVVTFPLCGITFILVTIISPHLFLFFVNVKKGLKIWDGNLIFNWGEKLICLCKTKLTFNCLGIIIENSSWAWVFYVSAILTLVWVGRIQLLW